LENIKGRVNSNIQEILKVKGIQARVTSVTTGSEALNNNGEIVMTVQSENPETFEVRTFIVKARPKS
jgi:hypothetical protein